MKVIKKVVISVIYFILGLLVIYNVYNFTCIKLLKQDLPTVAGYGVLEVVSGSMEPTIHVGDLVIVNTNNNDYKKDDIITFYDNAGSFVTHRIIEVKDNYYITKGDNNNTEDKEKLSDDKIVGTMVKKISNGGKFMAALRSPIVLVMILIIGILICYLVSTDRNGEPILSEEEKEYEEFLEFKKLQEGNGKKDLQEIQLVRIAPKNETAPKKSTLKKTTTTKKPATKTITTKASTPKKTTTKSTTAKKTTSSKAKPTTTTKKTTAKKTTKK